MVDKEILIKELDMCKTLDDYHKVLSKYELFDSDVPGNYFYCIHCERAFKGSNDTIECPYEDCDGHVGDLWNWIKVRLPSEFRSTEYPKVPELNKIYPLYEKEDNHNE